MSFEEWTSSLSAAITDWRFFIPLLIWVTVFSALCQEETQYSDMKDEINRDILERESASRGRCLSSLQHYQKRAELCFSCKAVVHRNSGPECHLLFLSNWLAVSEWDASSAGSSFPGTWCHCSGSLRSRTDMLYSVSDINVKTTSIIAYVADYYLRVRVINRS